MYPSATGRGLLVVYVSETHPRPADDGIRWFVGQVAAPVRSLPEYDGSGVGCPTGSGGRCCGRRPAGGRLRKAPGSQILSQTLPEPCRTRSSCGAGYRVAGPAALDGAADLAQCVSRSTGIAGVMKVPAYKFRSNQTPYPTLSWRHPPGRQIRYGSTFDLNLYGDSATTRKREFICMKQGSAPCTI